MALQAPHDACVGLICDDRWSASPGLRYIAWKVNAQQSTYQREHEALARPAAARRCSPSVSLRWDSSSHDAAKTRQCQLRCLIPSLTPGECGILEATQHMSNAYPPVEYDDMIGSFKSVLQELGDLWQIDFLDSLLVEHLGCGQLTRCDQ